MSNELSNMDYEKLAALTGVQVRKSFIPVLKINFDDEDAAGNEIKRGTFCVTQNNNTAYSESATFRPFIQGYQYLKFDPAANKFVNRSIIIHNFGEEAIDMLGGLACGKVPAKLRDQLNEAQLKEQKNISCVRMMYGLVTLPDAGLKNLPVLWQLKGSNFMAPDEAIKSIAKMKHQIFQHELALSTSRKKNGSVTYFQVNVEPDLKNVLPLTEDDVATVSMFREIVDRENATVAAKWRDAKQSRIDVLAAQDDRMDYIRDALSLDDDLPASMT